MLFCFAARSNFFSFCSPFIDNRFTVIRQTALAAEPTWAPPKDTKWEEKDFEAEITKLEKEAEARMDAKVAELKAKIESTGKATQK